MWERIQPCCIAATAGTAIIITPLLAFPCFLMTVNQRSGRGVLTGCIAVAGTAATAAGEAWRRRCGGGGLGARHKSRYTGQGRHHNFWRCRPQPDAKLAQQHEHI